MTTLTFRAEQDFFEQCILMVGQVLAENGMCLSYEKWQGRAESKGKFHLTTAIEYVARQAAPLAPLYDYTELDEAFELAAELKAYLVQFTPRRHYSPYAPMSLDIFNDQLDNGVDDVQELLQCAMEAYRPTDTGFRYHWTDNKVPGQLIWDMKPDIDDRGSRV